MRPLATVNSHGFGRGSDHPRPSDILPSESTLPLPQVQPGEFLWSTGDIISAVEHENVVPQHSRMSKGRPMNVKCRPRIALLAGIFSGCVLLGPALHAGGPAPATDRSAASVEDTIVRIERTWADALVKGDLAAWNRCLADDWIGTTPEGTIVTKAGAYSDLKARRVTRELFRLDDLKVRVYGETAIAFGLETEKSRIHGKDMSGQYRFTDVFVQRDGRWQAVASHLSRVAVAH